MEVIGIIILVLVLYFSLFHSPNSESPINDNNNSSDNLSSLAKEIHTTFHATCDILESSKQADRDSLVKSLKDMNPEVDNEFLNLRVISIPIKSNSLVAQIQHIGGSAMDFKEFNFTITGVYEYQGLSLSFSHERKKRDIRVVNAIELFGLDPLKHPEASVGEEAQKLYQCIIAINGGDKLPTKDNSPSSLDNKNLEDTNELGFIDERRKKELIAGANKNISFTKYALKNLDIASFNNEKDNNVTDSSKTQLKDDLKMIQSENTKMMKVLQGDSPANISNGEFLNEIDNINEVLDFIFERIIQFDDICRNAHIKYFNGDVNKYDNIFN